MTSLNQNTILIVECYLNFRWLVILEYETLSNIPFKFLYEKLYWSTISFKIVLRENWHNTIHILSEYTKWLISSSLSFVFIFSFFCYEYNFKVLKLIFKLFLLFVSWFCVSKMYCPILRSQWPIYFLLEVAEYYLFCLHLIYF